MLMAAVIGCGAGGRLSMDALRLSERYELVAAADVSNSARQAIAAEYSDISLFSDYRDMLAHCATDVVCVATPAPTHKSIGTQVAQHQPRGLLLEKPLACDVVSAGELLREIDRRKIPLVVPHGMLVLPAAQKIKTCVRQGGIGIVRSIEVQNAVDLLNAGIHWIVYLLDVLEEDCVSSVLATFDSSGRVVSDAVQVESSGVTSLTTRNGVNIVLYSGKEFAPHSDVLPKSEQKGAIFRLTGTAGVIEFAAWSDFYWILSAAAPSGDLVDCTVAGRPGYHQTFLDALASQIERGECDYRVAQLSLAALGLIQLAYRSHRVRRRIRPDATVNDESQGGDDWRLGAAAHSQLECA